jgi:hypothetical protein
VSRRLLWKEREPDRSFAGVDGGGVILLRKVDLLLGIVDLGFDVRGQGTPSLSGASESSVGRAGEAGGSRGYRLTVL